MHFVRLASILLALLAIAPASAQDTGWQVTHSIELEPEREFLLLSPDGRKIFEVNPHEPAEICVQNISMFETTCDGIPGGIIDPASVTWAPDSSAVAFSIDWLQSGIDSDIFVQDAETGAVMNLTDDGVEEYYEATEPFAMDTYPSWAVNSGSLVFQRASQDQPEHPIMRIARDGGEPEVVATFPDGVAPVINGRVHLLGDGTRLFSTIPNPREPELAHGVFRMTPDGRTDMIVPGPEDGRYATSLLDISPDGRTMLVAQPHLMIENPAAPYVFLMDAASGEELVPIEGNVVAPIFLPDGSGVLAATLNEDRSLTLTIMTLDNTATELVTLPAAEPEPGLAAVGVSPSLTWSEVNVILVHTSPGTTLLQVEPGSGAAVASPASNPVTPAPMGTPTPDPDIPATPDPATEGEAPYRALRPDAVAPGAEMALLSPDGGRVAILSSHLSTELCVREIETFDETCAEIGIDSQTLQGIEWSSDSTALAFTSDPLLTGLDSDIWLMDAISGEVANLTDDGSDELATPGSTMDIWPGWSPDGDIIFQRYALGADSLVHVSLMRIAPDGGKPEEIVRFPREYATIMSGPAFLLDDGAIILGTMPATGFTTGIFRVSPEGAFAHLADQDLIPGQDSVVVLDVTADGSTALVYGRHSLEIRFHGGDTVFMDLETGEVTQPDSLADEPIVPATFSPDDTQMLSVVGNDDGTRSLMVTDLASGVSWALAVIDPALQDGEAMWPLLSLVWAENDTVGLHTGVPTSVLIPLAE